MVERREQATDPHAVIGPLVLALVGGPLIGSLGLAPTGLGKSDFLLVGILAGLTVIVARSAPWWVIGSVGAASAGLAAGWMSMTCGLAAAALASLLGASRGSTSTIHRYAPTMLCTATVLALIALADGRSWGAFAMSGTISTSLGAAVFISGIHGLHGRTRRMTVGVVLALSASTVIIVVLVGVSLLGVRGTISDANRTARAGLAYMTSGDLTSARDEVALSAASFMAVESVMTRPWMRLGRLLPVIGQHLRLLDDVATTAGHSMTEASSALSEIDPERLRVVNGRIDIAAIDDLIDPFTRLRNAVADVHRLAIAPRDSWIAPVVGQRLDDLAVELDGRLRSADTALHAVRVAPAMLGAERPRRYFIAFTTPGEARGLGGFFGNWAEITVTDGLLELTDFGRKEDLVRPWLPAPTITGMDELLAHWGRFGFSSGENGATSKWVWANITMPPDMPTVGQAMAQLYSQVSGHPIDTVLVIDAKAMGAILQITGPLLVDGVSERLTPSNVADFITLGQYEQQDYDARVDVLDRVARTAMDTLLTSTLPAPAELGALFSPLVRDLHMMAWSADADEQSFLEAIKMDATFPRLDGGDGFVVTVDNGSGNKIENFLRTTVTYDDLSQPDGERRLATITLTNEAPTSGYPAYVIGNLIDQPTGWNRLWLSAYSARPMVSATLDGEPLGMQTSRVWGWNVATKLIDIPPGETVTVVMELSGPISDPSAPFATRVQPLVKPISVTFP